jgi:predicted transcriptional regulator
LPRRSARPTRDDTERPPDEPMSAESNPRSPTSELRLQDTLRLSAEGVAKVLGDLEAKVIHTVWALDAPAAARTVHERIVAHHPVAIHTVITVLNKLVTKGLLCRKKLDDVYHYRACYSEVEFRRAMSRRAVEGILSLGPQAVAASMVDVLAERDPEQLESLMRLIQKRMSEDREDG